MMPLLLLLLLVLLAALAGACRGDGFDDRATVSIRLAPTPTPTPEGPTPTPAPPPELVLSAESVVQGGALLVSVTGAVSAGTVTFLDRRYNLAPGERSMFTFVGIGTEDAAGTFPLRVDFTLSSGSPGNITHDVTVEATEWTVDFLEFDAEQQALLDPAVVAAEEGLLAGVYGGETPEKLWTGLWQYPVPGVLTARFGEQRSYNGSEPSGHHSGTDLGGEMGDPVIAANGGVVVLARALEVRGNMVIIDHGGGLFSGYAHLSGFNAVEGQEVAGGDTIGMVGSTGLSTGPHLHWEMSVHGILVDALRFADGTNGF
jgi:murein DD-endopeptidase MepM/ murein hydrolase activator NlpD